MKEHRPEHLLTRLLAALAVLAAVVASASAQYEDGVLFEFDTCGGLVADSYEVGWKRAFPEAGATWKDAVVTTKQGATIRGTLTVPYAAVYAVNIRVALQGTKGNLRLGHESYPVIAPGSSAGPDAPREWVELPLGTQELAAGPIAVELTHQGRALGSTGAQPLAFVDFLRLRPAVLPYGKVVIAGVAVTDQTGQAATLPLSGDLLNISVLIQNNAEVVLPQSHLICRLAGREIGRTWTDPVPPGGQKAAQIPWRAEQGKHVLQLDVEPAADTDGIDASSARADVTISVAGSGRPRLLADLTILDAETHEPAAEPVEGDALEVKVSAQNVGDVLADSVRATIRADGEPLPPALIQLGNMPSGGAAEGSLEWSPLAGTHTLDVELVATNFDSRFGEPLGRAAITVAEKAFPWPIVLGAVAGASLLGVLALVLLVRARRSRPAPEAESGAMNTCSRCGRAFPAGVNYCPDDGTRLV